MAGIFGGRGFLAEVFGDFWGFWRLGVFGVFVGLGHLRHFDSMFGHQCCNIDILGCLRCVVCSFFLVWS